MKSYIWTILLLLAVLPGVEGFTPEVVELGGFGVDNAASNGGFYVTDFTTTPTPDGLVEICNTFVVIHKEPIYETCYGEVAEFSCEDAAQQICSVQIVEKEHQCQVGTDVFEKRHVVCRTTDGDYLKELN